MSFLRRRRLRRSIVGVSAGIDACLALARDPERWSDRDPEVSGWSVGEHVEHLYLADRGVLSWIPRALDDPGAPEEGGPSRIGRVVLLTGRIPRGRGRAPEGTGPSGAEAPEVAASLPKLADLLSDLGERSDEVAACRATLGHPALGHFDTLRWLRFLHIHHAHHRRIIDEIPRSAGT